MIYSIYQNEGVIVWKVSGARFKRGILLSALFLVVLFTSASDVFAQSPDLYIEEIRYVVVGNRTELKVGVGNNGDTFPDKDVEVEVKINQSEPGSPPVNFRKVHACPLNLLKPRQIHYFTVKIPRMEKPFTAEVTADFNNRISEKNENNNRKQRRIAPPVSGAPAAGGPANLKIGKFYAVPYSGGRVYFRIHILNTGSAFPDADFSISLEWSPGEPLSGNKWKRKSKDHPPGSEVILTSGYIHAEAGKPITFTVTVDPENRVKETNEADNKRSIIYP